MGRPGDGTPELKRIIKKYDLQNSVKIVEDVYNRSITIGVAKEIESPENPGGLEKRVALIPSDIEKLVKAGLKVYVEIGAGEGIGFTDPEYQKAGALLQPNNQIYSNYDFYV